MSDPKPPAERTLLGTDDAMIWAMEFCRVLHGKMIMSTVGIPDEEGDGKFAAHYIDEGGMVGWFANAMQTAISLYERRKLHEKGELTEAELFLKTWDEEHPEAEPDDGATLEEQFLEGFQEGRPPT